MLNDEMKIIQWEMQRKEFLVSVIESLEVDRTNLDSEPSLLLSALDEFIAGQDYNAMDENDWAWLHTFLAAYIAQIFMIEHHARWGLGSENGRDSYRLMVDGSAGAGRSFDPLELVFEDFHKGLPPEIVRMLATAEEITGVTPDTPADI